MLIGEPFFFESIEGVGFDCGPDFAHETVYGRNIMLGEDLGGEDFVRFEEVVDIGL